MDMCEAVERNRGEGLGVKWWEQAGHDLAMASETAASAEEADKDGLEE